MSYKRFQKPWLTDALMKCLNRKHELFRLYRRNLVSFENYNLYKNIFTSSLRQAKSNFFKNKFHECSGDAKKSWKCLNSLIKNKKKHDIIKLENQFGEISDSDVVAKTFSDYFANVALTLNHSIPVSDVPPLRYMDEPNCNSFFGFPTDHVEVGNLILSFPSKSSDLNCIPVYIF